MRRPVDTVYTGFDKTVHLHVFVLSLRVTTVAAFTFDCRNMRVHVDCFRSSLCAVHISNCFDIRGAPITKKMLCSTLLKLHFFFVDIAILSEIIQAAERKVRTRSLDLLSI